MATRVETDMREFEGALDEEWCHVAMPCLPLRNYCGAGMSEAGRAGKFHTGSLLTERCEGCGGRNCPDCVRLALEADEVIS